MATTHVFFRALPSHAALELPADIGPRADMVRTDDAVHVLVDVPGVRLESLRLRFEPERLVVEGVREQPSWSETARVLQMEIGYGAFRRAFPLPPEADGEGISAFCENGVLQVRVPLKPRPSHPPRRVAVS